MSRGLVFDARGQVIDDDNPMPVKEMGGGLELRGLIAQRPAADAVQVGTVYWAVDRINQTNEFTVSDGSSWTEI